MFDKVSEIVKNAGKIALNYFMEPTLQNPRLKEDRTIVTEADISSQNYIIEQLGLLDKDYLILGEENTINITTKEINDLKNNKYVWVIDPVDGTASFFNNLPTWVVSLGLMEYGKPIAGWIYAPVWDQLYYALPNEDNAFLNGVELSKIKPNMKIQPNSCFMVDSKTFRTHYMKDFPGKIRSFGSTAFHITLVAAGTAIGASSIRNKIWDVAGASAIANRCGVDVKYISGEDINYMELFEMNHTKEPVITCHPDLFEDIRNLFQPISQVNGQ